MIHLELVTTVLLGTVVACGFTQVANTTPLSLDVTVKEQTSDRELHSVAIVTIRNKGDRNVALSRTYCACGLWLQLEIETSDHRPVPYPAEMPERIIVRPPRYECVPPNGAAAMTVDLHAFQTEFGGERSGNAMSFRLTPGNYLLRARYRDRSDRHRGCSSTDVEVLSDWVPFTVRSVPERTQFSNFN